MQQWQQISAGMLSILCGISISGSYEANAATLAAPLPQHKTLATPKPLTRQSIAPKPGVSNSLGTHQPSIVPAYPFAPDTGLPLPIMEKNSPSFEQQSMESAIDESSSRQLLPLSVDEESPASELMPNTQANLTPLSELPSTQTEQEPLPDLTMEIFVKSGLATQITMLPIAIENRVLNFLLRHKELGTVSHKLIDRYIALVREKFNTDYITESMLIYLDTQFKEREIDLILHWLDSKDAKLFTKLEAASLQPEVLRDMRNFTWRLKYNPPDKQRLALIKRLNQVTKAAESSLIVLMMEKLAVELVKVKAGLSPARHDVEHLIKLISKQRAAMEKEVTPTVINGMLFTYRNVEDEALLKYIEFADSGIGQKYHKAILGAYNSALIDASTEFGDAVVAP